ncbi:MAG: YigZ family protein [Bacilli bacterium]|nr:YigZ family protein [Bacilli bacterium]
MYKVSSDYKFELEEKKSKFIGFIFNINSEDEFKIKLLSIKEEYPKATHYVYAYKIDSIIRMSDDGEPSGTSASPIMNVLDKEKLNYTGIVIVRYFGGIKLGASGLVRAYSTVAKELIKNTKLDEIVFGKLINVNISYDKLDTFEYLVTKTNSKIIVEEFGEDVSCEIEVSNDNLNLFEKYNYKIKKDITM